MVEGAIEDVGLQFHLRILLPTNSPVLLYCCPFHFVLVDLAPRQYLPFGLVHVYDSFLEALIEPFSGLLHGRAVLLGLLIVVKVAILLDLHR